MRNAEHDSTAEARARPRPATRRAFIGGAATAAAAVLVGPATIAQAQTSAPTLVGDGKTDDAPAIQAMIDAGIAPSFVPTKTYLLNSPIFLDRAGSTAMLVLDLNGATLRLGGGLPTSDAFWRDRGTKWAIFPNTVRSALSGGKVTVSTATRASGAGTGALISLALSNGTIDGVGANVGLVFANRTGIRFEGIILRRARTLLSWNDYCDVNVFIQCHNRAGGPSNSVLVEQINSGDGLLMQSCKSDAAVGVARLKYCRGAEFIGTVTGTIELDACSAVHIRSGHQEAPVLNKTMVDVRSSQVVIDTTALYLTRGTEENLLPAIRIDDGSGIPSTVVLRDSIEMRALDRSDELLGPYVQVVKAATGTRIEARGQLSRVSSRALGGVWNDSIGPGIVAAGASAADLERWAPILAEGDFVMTRNASAWEVLSSRGAATVAGRDLASVAASIPTVVAETGMTGSLGTGSRRYRCQAVLADGRVGRLSGYSRVVSSSTGVLKLTLSSGSGAVAIRIWRYTATSSNAQAFVQVPCGPPRVTLYDTGTGINGYRWGTP